MKAKELKDKEIVHLQHELEEHQHRLFELRTQSVTEKLEDPSQLGKAKRDIARIKTELRARQIAEAAAKAKSPAPAATPA